MADVIRFELSVEEYEEVKKALVKRMAAMDESAEGYKKLDLVTGKIHRAQWVQTDSQKPDDGGQRTASQEVGDAQQEHSTSSPQASSGQASARPPQPQTSFKPTLPPLNTYQAPQSQKADDRGQSGSGTRVISDKQSKRLYAIQLKAGKKTFQVNEYLKRQYGIASSREVTVNIYDAVINWLQS